MSNGKTHLNFALVYFISLIAVILAIGMSLGISVYKLLFFFF